MRPIIALATGALALIGLAVASFPARMVTAAASSDELASHSHTFGVIA